MKVEKSIELGGRKLTLTSGTLAEQASAAVLAQYGETVVLATVVAAPLKVDMGYFQIFGQAISIDSIAMILRRDVGTPGG